MINPIRLLELAIAHGDVIETGTLLDAHPELLNARFPENVGLTPLMWACRNRHATIVEKLLERGASVNKTNTVEANGSDGGNTALWFTAQGSCAGNAPIARILLDYGAEIDARCEQGTTALFMAVAWVHMELVQILIACGADPNLRNEEGRTPLEQIRHDYDWLQGQETRSEDMKRFGYRAPRMIAYLEAIAANSTQS